MYLSSCSVFDSQKNRIQVLNFRPDSVGFASFSLLQAVVITIDKHSRSNFISQVNA